MSDDQNILSHISPNPEPFYIKRKSENDSNIANVSSVDSTRKQQILKIYKFKMGKDLFVFMQFTK